MDGRMDDDADDDVKRSFTKSDSLIVVDAARLFFSFICLFFATIIRSLAS